MADKTGRGVEAYKRTLTRTSDADADDWLVRLAENDFDKPAPKSEPKPDAREAPLVKAKPAAVGPNYGFEKKAAPTPEGTTADSKARRVAKFLILIGADEAAKVLENLDEDQVEEISREIAAIRGISSDEASAILEEFNDLLSGTRLFGGSNRGGTDEARRLLYAAFGAEKGEQFLRRAVKETGAGLFGFLEDFSPEQIMMLLRSESPAMGALILSRLDPEISAGVIAASDDEWRKETLMRIGRPGRVEAEVLETVAESLREKARHMGRTEMSDMDGPGALAAILKHSDVSFGDKILSELAESDADLSRDIKERLYTPDDVVKAEDKPIQEKLRTMESRDIAVLIRGRPSGFVEKIMSNISANRRAEVRTESDMQVSVLKKDAEKAITEFMEWFRTEREKGAILMLGDELVE